MGPQICQFGDKDEEHEYAASAKCGGPRITIARETSTRTLENCLKAVVRVIGFGSFAPRGQRACEVLSVF